MNICIDCKWYIDLTPKYGSCTNPKLDGYVGTMSDNELGKHDPDSGFSVGSKFGCIHWQNKFK